MKVNDPAAIGAYGVCGSAEFVYKDGRGVFEREVKRVPGKPREVWERRKGSMAENKTKPIKVSVAAFIDALTDQSRRADAKALVKLMQNAAGEKPKMWGPSIIGFGSHHYTYDSAREGEMPVVAFSPRKE